MTTTGFSGHTHSAEARERIRQAHLGKPHSLEHRAKIAAALRGKPKQYVNFWKGKNLPLEVRKRISAKLTGRTLPPGHRANISNGARGKKFGPESIAKRVASKRNHPDYAARNAAAGLRLRERWRTDHEFAKRMHLSLCSKKTKPEARVEGWLNELYPGQWEYTGIGGAIIGGMVPDFVHRGSRRIVLEVFGRYWHPPGDVRQRVAAMHHCGYATVIIWEDQTRDDLIALVRRYAGMEPRHD